jgi:hypothetical protein
MGGKGGRKGGLSFLETKSWALNNPVMLAKLSQAERAQLLEEQKALEVRKEREAEAQKELIKQQQIASGHITDEYADRIGWMYEKPPGFESAGQGGDQKGFNSNLSDKQK